VRRLRAWRFDSPGWSDETAADTTEELHAHLHHHVDDNDRLGLTLEAVREDR
jgi:hypothetical protein